MIPKIIHYCWFGGKPLPESAKKCIASWRKFLPDYEIKEWNESNFDVNSIKYTREAYRLKKFAFVSDYARMWILYNYGGLYFDTDVELIRPIDDIISRGNFMGFETPHDDCVYRQKQNGLNSTCPLNQGMDNINPGLGLGVEPKLKFYNNVINWYTNHHFATWKGGIGTTIVYVVTNFILNSKIEILKGGIYYTNGMYIYPSDYFCPKNYKTGELTITNNTRSIHHYSATWVKKLSVLERAILRARFVSAHFNLPFLY